MGATEHIAEPDAEPDPKAPRDIALLDPPAHNAPVEQKPELSAQIVKSPLAYIRTHHGEDALVQLAATAATTVEALERVGGWLSVRQVTAFLEGVHKLLGDDRRFREACGYGLWDSYGGMMLLVRAAATPALLYRVMAKTMHHVSHVSSYTAEAATRTSVRMRYRTESKDETRLLCLSRQAQIVQGPVPWGLPPAAIEETHCIAWGDDCCSYELKWDELIRRRVILASAGLATAAAIAIGVAGLASFGTAALGAIAVMLFVVAYEFYRLNGSNSRQRAKNQQTYEDTWARYNRTMHELLDLHEDQRRWNEDLERRIEDRTQALQGVVRQLEGHHQQDKSAVLSMSHDAINSLTAVKVTAELLVENPDDPYRDPPPWSVLPSDSHTICAGHSDRR